MENVVTKKKIVKVGWMFLQPEIDALYFPIEPLSKILATNSKTKFGKCPCIWDAYAQLFLIRSPIDIEIGLDGGGDLYGKPEHFEDTELYQSFFDNMASGSWRDPSQPITQIKLKIGFASDDPDTHLTILPPFLHPEAMNPLMRIVPGKLNIYDWPYRNMNMAFEWQDVTKKIIIKRGDPLGYVQLSHPDQNAKFIMVESSYDKCRYLMNNGDSFIGKVQGQAREIMKMFGKRRPKTVVIPRRE